MVLFIFAIANQLLKIFLLKKNNQIKHIVTFIKNIKNYNIYLYYSFFTEEVKILIYGLHYGNEKIFTQKFKNISFSSSKELEHLLDRPFNLLIFFLNMMIDKCPKCKNILKSQPDFIDKIYLSNNKNYYVTDKVCDNTADHKMVFTFSENENLYLCIKFVDLISNIHYVWYYLDQYLIVTKNNNFDDFSEIPYFEPDLFDFSKTLNKLKNYIIFL